MTEHATPAARAVAGLTLRRLRAPDDFPAMNEIANASRVAEGVEFYTTDDEFRSFYEHMLESDRGREVVVAELDGRLVAYVRVDWHDEVEARAYLPIVFVHPSVDRDVVYPALFDVADTRIAELVTQHPAGRKVARAQVPDAGPFIEATVRARGYQLERTFYSMVRPTLDDLPDALLPEGLEIRDVRPEDLDAIYDAETEAFRGQWGDAVPDDDSRAEWFRDPSLEDTALWRVAWDGDRVAGSVRSFINAAQNERLGRRRGWVEHISVGRPWRGRGVARALIATSFPLLRARGMTEGALGVDTANEFGALRLYERCGFRQERTTRMFSRTLE